MGRKVKAVYFNEEKESDLLSFIDGLDNFSEWVKDRLKREMSGNPMQMPDSIEMVINRLLDEKLKNYAPTASPSENNEQDEEIKSAIGKMF